MSDRIFYASRDKNKAYAVNLALTVAAGGTTEGIGYIKNTGNAPIYIKSVTVSSEEPDTGLTKFGIIIDPTISGGTTKTPVNLNTTSNDTCDCETKDTNVTLTGGSHIHTVRMNGMNSFTIDLYDAVILGKNNILGITGNAVTTSTKVRATIMYHGEVD